VNTKYVAWGAQFIDVDQDGNKDLIIANGHIYPELTGARKSEPFEMPRLLYWNIGNGAFRDVTKQSGAALSSAHSSRGLAIGDLDGDGTPEIIIVNMNAAPTILKNFGEKGNSLIIGLTGVQSNRSAIGAKIVVTTGAFSQTAVVTSGSSYLSQSDFRQHFGLGKAAQADRIDILWPNGRTESISNVPANQEIRVREGEGITARIAYAH
jgi:hypothetical protein